jgi:hypothetical protein
MSVKKPTKIAKEALEDSKSYLHHVRNAEAALIETHIVGHALIAALEEPKQKYETAVKVLTADFRGAGISFRRSPHRPVEQILDHLGEVRVAQRIIMGVIAPHVTALIKKTHEEAPDGRWEIIHTNDLPRMTPSIDSRAWHAALENHVKPVAANPHTPSVVADRRTQDASLFPLKTPPRLTA